MRKPQKTLAAGTPSVEESAPPEPRPSAKSQRLQLRDELVANSWSRMMRAPIGKLNVNETGNRLEISNYADHGTKPVNDKAALLIFNASLGSTDPAFADGLVDQLVNSTAGWEEPSGRAFGFGLAVIQGIEPRDEIEGMLAAQMAVIHTATMRFGRNLICAQTLDQRDSCERTLNKLSRTFTIQMEALKRYRSGGEQKVTVQHQHVTVNDGGQAMVGTVNTGGRGSEKDEQ